MWRLWRWLPGVALLVTTACLTLGVHTSLRQIVVYWAVLVWSVLLPGMLAFRTLRGRPTTLLADIAFGGATGLVLQLVAWAAFTAVGVQHWLILWPTPVVALFIAVPRLRKAWTIAPYERRLNPASSVAVALAGLILVQTAIQNAQESPLPGVAGRWYQDDYWHLELVGELMRAVPPELPQIAGRSFSYHWFANAHVAAMTLSTGLDTPLVFTRLWMAPILLLAALTIAAVGVHLTGRGWPGALAALMAAASPQIVPAWFSLWGPSPFGVHSPSIQFSVPLMMLALPPLIDILRGIRLTGRSWALLVIALVGVMGAKATVLPILICGLLLALAVSLLKTRRLPRTTAAALGVTVLVTALMWPIVSGGASGAKVQLFATIRALEPWTMLVGVLPSDGLLPPGIGRPGALLLLVLLVLVYTVAFAWVLLGLPTLRRNDLTGWALLGTGIAGFAAMMLVNQDGLSQVYFMKSAVLAWILFAVWGFSILTADCTRQTRRWSTATLTTACAAAGALLSAAAHELFPRPPAPDGPLPAVALSLVPWTFGAIVVAGALVAARRTPARLAQVRVAAAALVLGAAFGTSDTAGRLLATDLHNTMMAALIVVLAVAVALFIRAERTHLRTDPRRFFSVAVSGCLVTAGAVLVAWPPTPATSTAAAVALVQPAEAGAARWLRDNSQSTDIVASNVHCQGKVTTDPCDARAFWVGAFSERRILVEAWAYTPQAHLAHGVNGRSYSLQPFDDPDLFALNEAAFRSPTADGLDQLRAKGVRFLFADSLAGEVSPELARLATLVHTEGPVTIYEL